MLSSRERVQAALNHLESDRVPLDLGATNCSGIHVSSLYALRAGARSRLTRDACQGLRTVPDARRGDT